MEKSEAFMWLEVGGDEEEDDEVEVSWRAWVPISEEEEFCFGRRISDITRCGGTRVGHGGCGGAATTVDRSISYKILNLTRLHLLIDSTSIKPHSVLTCLEVIKHRYSLSHIHCWSLGPHINSDKIMMNMFRDNRLIHAFCFFPTGERQKESRSIGPPRETGSKRGARAFSWLPTLDYGVLRAVCALLCCSLFVTCSVKVNRQVERQRERGARMRFGDIVHMHGVREPDFWVTDSRSHSSSTQIWYWARNREIITCVRS